MEMIAILLTISVWHAWRYSKMDIDPDWAMFNLPGFTGSHYGRDFVDCKTPFIHYWFWCLARIVGADIGRVKFTHHLLLGSVGALLYAMTGNFWNALAFTVLINSGWLMAFHGNVGQIPAALFAVAIASGSPVLAGILGALAVAHEPKLVVTFAVFAALNGLWWGAMVIPPAVALAIVLRNEDWFKKLWESAIIIPVRMQKYRKIDVYPFMPWFTATPTLHLLPWIFIAVASRPDWRYWLPAVAFLAVTATGKVVRPNHLIPLVAWVALAGIEPMFVIALALTDFISAGGYWKGNWHRFYIGLVEANREARLTGQWLAGKAGTMWVNGIHTGAYIYARKPVPFGMAEQVEIRDVASERRAEMKQRWAENPPDYVIQSYSPGVKFNGQGYQKVAEMSGASIWRKNGRR